METNDTLAHDEHHDDHEMVLSQSAQYYLQQAGKWAEFLGVVGFIVCVFMLLGAIGAGSMGSMMANQPGIPAGMSGIMGPAIGAFYFVFAIVYFIFSLYLYQFGARIKKGIAFINNDYVTEALGKLKSFFKYWGILTIVFMIVYALAIVALIMAGGKMLAH
ncbi:hypothetical protein C8P68_101545 [Mucilaginibacter yixingensis]|uniref:Uncharacterized protein n=1 Tax=Mucilaginibacter yixingensis TaxID=1295612 RepID=A0A2T5JFW0_9SPHI|nr:DUF5362 family protein [Mucilaginibacter yixingensis]PTR01311.1 hypothetical protein C8P68_101545 [Mucilaginibacter yixingensis]